MSPQPSGSTLRMICWIKTVSSSPEVLWLMWPHTCRQMLFRSAGMRINQVLELINLESIQHWRCFLCWWGEDPVVDTVTMGNPWQTELENCHDATEGHDKVEWRNVLGKFWCYQYIADCWPSEALWDCLKRQDWAWVGLHTHNTTLKPLEEVVSNVRGIFVLTWSLTMYEG